MRRRAITVPDATFAAIERALAVLAPKAAPPRRQIKKRKPKRKSTTQAKKRRKRTK